MMKCFGEGGSVRSFELLLIMALFVGSRNFTLEVKLRMRVCLLHLQKLDEGFAFVNIFK